MVHELCHTRHFNDSKRFWQLVEDYDANYKQHRRELNQLTSRVGLWGIDFD